MSTNEPRNHTTSREIQPKSADRLGLSAPRSWIRTDENNIEKGWPNNVRIIPNDSPQAGQTLYGHLKEKDVEIIGKDFGRNISKGLMKSTSRTHDTRLETVKADLRELEKPQRISKQHDNDKGNDDGRER